MLSNMAIRLANTQPPGFMGEPCGSVCGEDYGPLPYFGPGQPRSLSELIAKEETLARKKDLDRKEGRGAQTVH